MRNWLKRLLSGEPHFIIGGHHDPYMLRWFLIPRNRVLNIYLHKFLRDDDDRALHDHPWWFFSFMVKGEYFEHTETGVLHRQAPSFALRRAKHRHRVELYKWVESIAGLTVTMPCWTIVVTGPKTRTWGFWCPKGFVPWRQFVADDDAGTVGRGCGEMS